MIGTVTYHTATTGRMALVEPLKSNKNLNYSLRFKPYSAVNTVLPYHPLNAVKNQSQCVLRT